MTLVIMQAATLRNKPQETSTLNPTAVLGPLVEVLLIVGGYYYYTTTVQQPAVTTTTAEPTEILRHFAEAVVFA